MLGDHTPTTTLGVFDLQRARDFYEGTLGFSPGAEMMDQGVTYPAGSSSFFVYTSEFAGTNKATAMMLELPSEEFDTTVADLRSKGVAFQTFDAEGMEWDDAVASAGGGAFKSVWITDPDGNIINFASGAS